MEEQSTEKKALNRDNNGLTFNKLLEIQVKAIAESDRNAAWEKLVKEMTPRLYRYAFQLTNSREEAEDIAQETMLRAYNEPRLFDEEFKTASWCWKVASRLCMGFHRSAARFRRAFSRMVNESEPGSPSPELHIIKDEVKGTMMKCLSDIPERYRSVLVLTYSEELSALEAAEALGISEGAVYTRLHRGRALLKEGMKRRGYEKA